MAKARKPSAAATAKDAKAIDAAVASPLPTDASPPHAAAVDEGDAGLAKQDRLWSDDGWTAKVIKNEEDDGWAVAMTLDGTSEPALVGPWTMGRDKKNPKPLDAFAFATLVKTASEIIRRHEQQAHAQLHKSTKVASAKGRIRVALDIVPDEDQPYAELSATDDTGEELARCRVDANFRFNHEIASAWVASGYARPAGGSSD